MAIGAATYPGVIALKEMHYTQTLGVDPDAIALTMVPQAASVATAGTVTISYTGQTSITLPNCSIDSARTTYNTKGFVTGIVLADRRELWKKAAPVNGRYNILRNGVRVTATEKTLRELIEILLQACGEATPDVSNVSATVYPEVNWYCEKPVVALSALLREWGYDVELGFGSETVTVHELGVGTALPTDAVMMVSSGVDATLQPENVRVCYAPTKIQARFLLEAVALDTDNEYKLLADVSYKPAGGWGKVDPERLTELEETLSADDYKLASYSMYRIYRVKAFSDDTLDVPDGGSLTLTSINQVFPLDNRLLDTSLSKGEYIRNKTNIYGVLRLPESYTGQPRSIANSDIDERFELNYTLDGERGLVLFYDPIYKKDGSSEYAPADLYLECTFEVRDDTNNQQIGYEKDVLFDAAGFGYYPVKWPIQQLQVVTAYTAGHVPDTNNNVSNQALLDSQASVIATAAAGRFTATATQMVVYQYPRLALRLDGIRQQVTHIISDGEKEPGCYSIASVGVEYDRFTKSRSERVARTHALQVADGYVQGSVISNRKVIADD